jgi:hypothetical protein
MKSDIPAARQKNTLCGTGKQFRCSRRNKLGGSGLQGNLFTLKILAYQGAFEQKRLDMARLRPTEWSRGATRKMLQKKQRCDFIISITSWSGFRRLEQSRSNVARFSSQAGADRGRRWKLLPQLEELKIVAYESHDEFRSVQELGIGERERGVRGEFGSRVNEAKLAE